jgi:MFS family permease
VFAKEVLGSETAYGALLTAFGTGAAVGLFAIMALQKRLPRDIVFTWSVVAAGACLIAAVTFNVGGITALLIAATGACAVSAYVTGFTLIQEHVSDEMRGRTFATLYAVVRLCLLVALAIAPLFSDLFEWLFDVSGLSQNIRLGGFGYSFPGVRLALWGGGATTILAGLYARRSLQRYHAAHGEDSTHPVNGDRVGGPAPTDDGPRP